MFKLIVSSTSNKRCDSGRQEVNDSGSKIVVAFNCHLTKSGEKRIKNHPSNSVNRILFLIQPNQSFNRAIGHGKFTVAIRLETLQRTEKK